MEGDGLARDVPLEYLFGAVDMHGLYHAWWGHDEAGERRAFEQFVDFAIDTLDRHPDMHIYHYAAYEKTALRRLMSRHGTREEEVDRLLRNEVLVDLYRVVREGIRLSTDSYSLKKVERLYMPAREESIADAAGSMVMYERWLTSHEDGGNGDAALLDEIALYNERDCTSTVQLRDWLEARRHEEERLRGAAGGTSDHSRARTQRVRAGEGRRDTGGGGGADRGGAGRSRARYRRATRELAARTTALVSPARGQSGLVALLRSAVHEPGGARARHDRLGAAGTDRRARRRWTRHRAVSVRTPGASDR